MTTTIGDNESRFRVLPLSIQERKGRTTICCMAEHCMWSWPLYEDATETNGRAITSAVCHVRERHPQQDHPRGLRTGDR